MLTIVKYHSKPFIIINLLSWEETWSSSPKSKDRSWGQALAGRTLPCTPWPGSQGAAGGGGNSVESEMKCTQRMVWWGHIALFWHFWVCSPPFTYTAPIALIKFMCVSCLSLVLPEVDAETRIWGRVVRWRENRRRHQEGSVGGRQGRAGGRCSLCWWAGDAVSIRFSCGK